MIFINQTWSNRYTSHSQEQLKKIDDKNFIWITYNPVTILFDISFALIATPIG